MVSDRGDIDGQIVYTVHYLHVNGQGSGLANGWNLASLRVGKGLVIGQGVS